MRSFVLTEDAAREIVKAGTAKKYRSTQEFRRPSEPLSASSLQVFENGVLVSSAAQILDFADGLTVEAVDARIVRILGDASVTVDGEPIREIVVRAPLVYELSADALTIKAGTFWDNSDGSAIIANASGALPNSCHVRGGKGIRIVDGGECGHGAADGFIAQIDWKGLEVLDDGSRVVENARTLDFGEGVKATANGETVKIEGSSLTLDGQTVREIVVQEPLVYNLTGDILTIKAGVFWDNLDGSAIANASGALPNSCHVRGGKGIRIVDGGGCAHGAADGFIAQIDWAPDAEAVAESFGTATVLTSLKDGEAITYGRSLDVSTVDVVAEIESKTAKFLTAATLEASSENVEASRITDVAPGTFVSSVATTPATVATLKDGETGDVVVDVETEDVQFSTLLSGAVVKGVVVGIDGASSGDGGDGTNGGGTSSESGDGETSGASSASTVGETSSGDESATGGVGSVVVKVEPTSGKALKDVAQKEGVELKPNFPNVEKKTFLRSPTTSVEEGAIRGGVWRNFRAVVGDRCNLAWRQGL